jgi:antagonist of KipI
MKILKPGLFTSIQDLGRFGYQKFGVVVGGAMDTFALRIANILVGNPEDEAAIEITMQGPTIELEEDAWLAICGASLSPELDGYPVPEWRPFHARRGSVLKFGRPMAGCRAYLAVAGGFAVDAVMGSKSVNLQVGIGGGFGRILQEGDTLSVGPASEERGRRLATLCPAGFGEYRVLTTGWYVSPNMFPDYREAPVIRFLPGPEYGQFTESSRVAFASTSYIVGSKSDRMGYRLDGPKLRLHEPKELISTAVTFGTVQVPPDGQPIVLMADRQTTGGYPRIAQIITADLPVLAQLRPGSKVRFESITLDAAVDLLRRRERVIQWLKCGIQMKGDH